MATASGSRCAMTARASTWRLPARAPGLRTCATAWAPSVASWRSGRPRAAAAWWAGPFQRTAPAASTRTAGIPRRPRIDRRPKGDEMGERGLGRALFAAILLMVAGVINIIYGIAAISDSKFFVNETRYVFSSLHTWGWLILIWGV